MSEQGANRSRKTDGFENKDQTVRKRLENLAREANRSNKLENINTRSTLSEGDYSLWSFFNAQGVASNSYAHQTSAVLSETFFRRSCKKSLP